MDGAIAKIVVEVPEIIAYIRLLQEWGIVDKTVILVEKAPPRETTRAPEED